MRISDWSSDVCSSDLSNQEYAKMPAKLRMNVIGSPGIDKADFELFSLAVSAMNGCGACIDSHERSEEHTSELQSLMRISYAVFCLQKKNTRNTHLIYTTVKILKQKSPAINVHSINPTI